MIISVEGQTNWIPPFLLSSLSNNSILNCISNLFLQLRCHQQHQGLNIYPRGNSIAAGTVEATSRDAVTTCSITVETVACEAIAAWTVEGTPKKASTVEAASRDAIAANDITAKIIAWETVAALTNGGWEHICWLGPIGFADSIPRQNATPQGIATEYVAVQAVAA